MGEHNNRVSDFHHFMGIISGDASHSPPSDGNSAYGARALRNRPISIPLGVKRRMLPEVRVNSRGAPAASRNIFLTRWRLPHSIDLREINEPSLPSRSAVDRSRSTRQTTFRNAQELAPFPLSFELSFQRRNPDLFPTGHRSDNSKLH